MKHLERGLLFVILAGLIMAPQTAQVNSYVNGNVLTANQLNSEFGNIYSTINGLDEDNFLPTTVIGPEFVGSSIAGDGLARDGVTGVLSVNTDASTVETNADVLRVKDLGITTAKLAAGAVTSAKLSSSVTVAGADGSNAAPAFSFSADPDTGMYRKTTNVLGFSAAGGERLVISSTQIDMGLAGSAATPSIILNNDVDTGFYMPAANQLGITVGGGSRFTVSTSQIDMGLDGSAAAPSVVLNSDTDTGIYKPAANQFAVSAAGSNVATFSSSGLSATAIASGSANYIKWKVCTGNIAAGGTTTCNPPSGIVLSASGWTDRNNTGFFQPLESNAAAGGSDDRIVIDSVSSTSTVVTLRNDDASDALDYRVVVMYQ